MSDVTQILSSIERGDPHAAEQLLPLVYEQLRSLAAARMAAEGANHTLQSTALVHEAYLRLVDGRQPQHWNSRGHFFGAAAEAMRRILVEHARRRSRGRDGDARRSAELGDVIAPAGPDADTILAVDEALTRLADDDPAAAQVVKLHFFAGLTLDETADVLRVSRASVYRHWAYARAVLRLELRGAERDGPN
jgi:RNA polymerase sigma factor (TIGR02999 family)